MEKFWWMIFVCFLRSLHLHHLTILKLLAINYIIPVKRPHFYFFCLTSTTDICLFSIPNYAHPNVNNNLVWILLSFSWVIWMVGFCIEIIIVMCVLKQYLEENIELKTPHAVSFCIVFGKKIINSIDIIRSTRLTQKFGWFLA